MWFEVLMSFWSLGLFAYPQIAPILFLAFTFYKAGALTQIAILLYSVILIYGKLTEVLGVVRDMYGLLFMCLSLSCLFWGSFSNCTQFVGRGGGDGVSQPFTSFFPLESGMSPFENVPFPLNAEEAAFLVLYLTGLLYTVYSFSKIRAEISRGANETHDQGVENPEWCGEWEDMGQTLKEFSDLIAWNFPPEQIQNPAEVGKYLKQKGNDNSNEKKLIAMCWALAYAYRTLLGTAGQQIKAEGQEGKSADTLFIQAAAEPDMKPKPMIVAPVTRRKHKTKTDRPVKDDDDRGGGPSRPATDSEPEIIIESMSLKDLCGIGKDYTRQSDESMLSWLVHIWDAAGDTAILNGTEARHLGSLSHDPAIDQEMVRPFDPLSLRIRLFGSVSERYQCQDDLYLQQTPWKTIEQAIQRLRELVAVEIVFTPDPIHAIRNPDLIIVTPAVWIFFLIIIQYYYFSTEISRNSGVKVSLEFYFSLSQVLKTKI